MKGHQAGARPRQESAYRVIRVAHATLEWPGDQARSFLYVQVTLMIFVCLRQRAGQGLRGMPGGHTPASVRLQSCVWSLQWLPE
jgi:hypothetical protein